MYDMKILTIIVIDANKNTFPLVYANSCVGEL